jgi:hypothetical protein
MYQYSDKSKKKYIKKGGKRLEIEIIFNPAQTLSHSRDKIISDMRQITKLAWADFGYVVSQWFDWASILLIVRYRGEIVGFSANEFLDGNVVVFLSTMILPNFKNMGLSKTLQRFAFKQFLLRNFNFKFWKYFKKIYFVFRTPNPSLVAAVLKYNSVPSINGRKPTREELEIAKKIANKFSHYCVFNEEHFVIKGALKHNPDLIFNLDEIPYSNNKMVNEFCKRYLKYEKKEGNLLVVVGHPTFLQKILALFSN